MTVTALRRVDLADAVAGDLATTAVTGATAAGDAGWPLPGRGSVTGD